MVLTSNLSHAMQKHLLKVFKQEFITQEVDIWILNQILKTIMTMFKKQLLDQKT